MPLIEINEKNKMQYGGKCVVLQSHINAGVNVQPGDVVEKFGMDYFEGKQCKMIRDYDPAIDEPKKELSDAEAKLIIDNMEVEPVPDEPKKLGPKKKIKKDKGA